MAKESQNPTSIEKALIILSCFIPYNQELGTHEISKILGYHKATVNRILLTLAKHGYLSQNSQTRKFALGPVAVDIGQAVNRALKTNFLFIAKPFIDGLRDELEETVTLEVTSGNRVFMAYIAEGPQLVRLAGNIGEIVPINAASGAKAILAFSPKDIVLKFIDVEFQQYTPNTITDRSRFLAQLDKIRAQGYALDNEEIAFGTVAIGVPIFNHEGVPLASLIVAGPPQRIPIEDGSTMIAALKDTAEKISAQLYFNRDSHIKK
jgi:DNA-binding IclR family transcriptional regulator